LAENWSDEELEAAVVAYLDMLGKQNRSESFVKKQAYRALSQRFPSRSESSFEYRMQNISYVLAEMGRTHLTGLLPAKNVGTRTAEKIEKLIAKVEDSEYRGIATHEADVSRIRYRKTVEEPQGIAEPSKHYAAQMGFKRDAQVKAWVLQTADDVCECCGAAAPFQKYDGSAFLETHHVKPLADGGSDSITNLVAICPNCHRELHYGQLKTEKRQALYQQIPRLKKE